MSLALATKGMIAGIGWGSSTPAPSGKYPSSYLAGAIAVAVDLGNDIAVESNRPSVTIALDDVGIDVSIPVSVSVEVRNEDIGVEV
jgi:hypothetical protein